MVLMLSCPPFPWCLCSILLLRHSAHTWFSSSARAQVAGEERGWSGENCAPARDPPSRRRAASVCIMRGFAVPSPGSTHSRRRRNSRRLYSLSSFNCRCGDVFWWDRGKTTASADRCTCPNGSLKLNENFSVLHSSACVI